MFVIIIYIILYYFVNLNTCFVADIIFLSGGFIELVRVRLSRKLPLINFKHLIFSVLISRKY
jgi:hypothetical protein